MRASTLTFTSTLTLAFVLSVLGPVAPLSAAEQDDLRALKLGLGKVLLHDYAARRGNGREGIEALQLPTGEALTRALKTSTESVKTADGDRIIWNNGRHVRQALHEIAAAARDRGGRVSVDGPIHGRDGIVGVVLDSYRYDRTVSVPKTTQLRLWVGKLGNKPALFLKDRFARHPVVVPLPQTPTPRAVSAGAKTTR